MKAKYAPNGAPGSALVAECANCGKRYTLDKLAEYHDFWSRIEPGDIVPAGDCPDEVLIYMSLISAKGEK